MCKYHNKFHFFAQTNQRPEGKSCGRGLTSRACLRKVLFSTFAHSMHSRQRSTSWPVAASMSRKRSSKERTSLAALALEMEVRKGRTYFNRPPSSGKNHGQKGTFCTLKWVKLLKVRSDSKNHRVKDWHNLTYILNLEIAVSNWFKHSFL